MPVRTHRGRAAVYRKIWGWPLRSTTHLAITGAVMAIAVTAIGLATDTTDDEEPRTTRPGPSSTRDHQLPTRSPDTITPRPSTTITGTAAVVDTSDFAAGVGGPSDALVLRLTLVDTATGRPVGSYTHARRARHAQGPR